MTAQTLERTPVTSARGATRKPRRKPRAGRIASYVVIAVLAFGWLVPVLWAVMTSLKTEAEAAAAPITIIPESGFTLDAYARVLSSSQVPRWALNSLITATAVTLITLVISALAGYALSRLDFKGKKVAMAVIIGSIMVPGQILIVPLFQQMLDFNLVDTYWGVILPQIVAAPMVFILKKFFDQIPRELEEAALVDGASRLRILRQIIVPLSRPILAAVSIFVFIGAWNNFLWPFIVTSDPSLMTLPVGP